MTRSNRAAIILGATALLALSLTAPAAATETRSLSPASPALTSDVSSANIPLPRARPYVRKRIGAWPIVRPTSRQIATILAPYRRVVVAHWPVLMLGVGF